MQPAPSRDIFSHSETLFAEVILPFSLAQTFSYRVPAGWNEQIETGKRVVVPFGKKKFYAGIIHTISNKPPQGYEAKYLQSVLDDSPLLTKKHLDFWQWMASYYMCNLGDVMAAALPSALKLASENIIQLHPDWQEISCELDPKEEMIIESLQNSEQLSIAQIEETVGLKNVFHLIKSLYFKGLILPIEEIRNRYKPKLRSLCKLNKNYLHDNSLRELLNDLEKKAPKQCDLLMAYLDLSPKKEWADKKKLLEKSGANASVLKSMVQKGVFEIKDERIDRVQWDDNSEMDSDLQLNEEQQKVFVSIKEQWQEKDTVLLKGITGSGKSFVYFSLIREVLDAGKQALYLLPEIALTVQLVNKMRKQFGAKVILSHSRFNNQERAEVFEKIASGHSCVVLGARSAVFLPFRDLKIIVIDEEHDHSFKQYDPAPRYHARDASLVLAKLFEAKTILGSATPAVESFYNAQSGKYGFAEIKNRYGDAVLPEVQIVDMGEMQKKNLMRSYFSKVLLDEIKAGKEAKEQSIIFQNRKGYVPIMMCRSCGWTSKCISCDISLTYYKIQNILKCNYCGYHEKPTGICAKCGSRHLEFSGFGTEKIEEELALLEPDLHIVRFDQDSTRGKYAYQQIIHDIEEGPIDVVVGTQMVTKGLDFARVSTVGVINADKLMSFPDFRSHERAFQLLTQVSGRSGRRSKRGKVIIQTYQPAHPVMADVVEGNYQNFFERELGERERYFYPPFSRLIKITVKHKEAEVVDQASIHLANMFKKLLGHRVLGPEVPYVSRLRNYYLRGILVKLEKEKLSAQKVKAELISLTKSFHTHKEFKKVVVVFDADPY